jgi:hypothetical protein
MHTRLNHPHQNKRNDANRSDMVAKAPSTNISIILTQVSVPAEDG